ncbi:conserved protein of unknown function [Tenacibaculum jejuense]|uniref:Heme oxygenase n=2 Tax=Tenacibaculum jejuense TaxID=584609 RepID=A0A238U8M1_9FLAO|nr:conserved protein of unknown function [Tenacibaculum jejuense]
MQIFRFAFFVKTYHKMRIEFIENQLEDLRKQLQAHSLYATLKDIEDIKTFMEEHVFAVWDFMSLLKALQFHLTNTNVPWLPVRNSVTARFINEIVHGEETDINELGEPKSHFEMYLDAMNEVGANTSEIDTFVEEITDINSVINTLKKLEISETTQKFVAFTFDVIKVNQPHIIAACFTFGREDIIPDMFLEIIKKAELDGDKKFTKLKYYLERHIELDGDEHGPLSLQMISELCGNDEQKWNDVLKYARKSMQMRINLWNGIEKKIKKSVLV